MSYGLLRDLSIGNYKEGIVPDKEVWEIKWAHAKFTTTATKGDRLLVMSAFLPDDPETPLARTFSPIIQRENTARRYQMFPGISSVLPVLDVSCIILPNTPMLLSGWKFTLTDFYNVDVNDHLELRSTVIQVTKE